MTLQEAEEIKTRYLITKDGVIVNKSTLRTVKGKVERNGYKRVMLTTEKVKKLYLVHRLVMFAHRPISDISKNHVNHKDGNKLNNSLENLEWVSRSENSQHAIKMGLIKTGEDSKKAKLTNEKVRWIKQNQNRLTGSEIARRLGMSTTHISRIINGEYWEHIKP